MGKAADLSRLLNNTDMDVVTFNKYLQKLVKAIEEDVTAIFIEAAQLLWADVVDHTPVLTGLAQNNWQLDTKPNNTILHEEVLELKRVTPPEELSRVLDNPHSTGDIPQLPKSVQDDFIVYLFNNLHYIEDLELGSSKSNKSMLSNALAQGSYFMDKVAKKYGYI